ncbi:MAG: B12-binding domain-containing radical SAM protein [Planctomycetota bacterium]|nr:MAG: B12-binding domain-containing radical SAM protein [Planctomycetota bacterium]
MRKAVRKKFLLVNVPTYESAYHSFQDFIAMVPPIGLTSIAAVIENMGYEVKILDATAENLTFAQTLKKTVAESPDYVGATTMTATMDIIGEYFSQLRIRLPDVITFVGGPHASAVPEKTLEQFSGIDIAVIGEGEETITELMPVLENGDTPDKVKGVAFRKDNQIILTEQRPPIHDLGKLPMPAYHLLNFRLYRSYGWNAWVNGYRSPLGVVFMGRGCFGKCNFCAAHSVFGRGLRFFPPERIKTEIDLLMANYRPRILYFQDDTFTANRKMVNIVCDYMIEKGYTRRVEIMVSSRVDVMHLPSLKKMRKAGVRWICFGVESGSQPILDRMNKNTTIGQIRAAFTMAREAGLHVAGNYMIGHVDETWETAMETINLACELKQEYASFAIALPFPGSELYQYCLDNEVPLPSWAGFGSVNSPPIPLNKDLPQEKLLELRMIAVNRFFKRPTYLLGLLRKFRPSIVVKDFLNMYFAIRKERRAKRI